MSHFTVESCSIRACNNWRIGDSCVKNQMDIPTLVKYAATIHDSNLCQIRQQIDVFRLEQMLEKTG